MGYKNTNLISNLGKISLILIILALLIIFIMPVLKQPFEKFEKLKKEDIGDNMELIFLNLGKADSIMIRYKEKVILIDTGEVEHGPHIVKSLKDIGVNKIDYLVLTHPDKDHIGGAIDIINSMEVELIIQSPLKDEKTLQKILNSTIKEKGIKSIVPDEKYKFSLGLAYIEIFPPENNSYKKDNDYSLLTLVSHNKLKFFFGGDAENKRLKEALKYDLPKVDLYKVPHHGRYNSKSTEMIRAISPKIAIITNTRADLEIIEALELQGSNILYTGEGHIRILSDGERLIVK